MKLQDYVPTDAMMLLFKGESGTGKTTAIASFPEPIYLACCDERIAPIKSNPLTKNRNIEFDMFSDFRSIVKKTDELINQNCPYRTVAVDPLFGYARLVISHLITARGGATEIKMGGEKMPLNIGGIPIMAINEYKGEEAALFNMIMSLRQLRKKGVNVILSAHVITSEQATLGGAGTSTRRLLTGGNKIAAEIPSYFDEMYHFYNTKGGLSTEPYFRAITAGNGLDQARTSFFGLRKEIDFTNKLFYDELMKAIKEDVKS